MTLEVLKEQVYEVNMELPRRGPIIYTWGNVSGTNRVSGLFVIKSGGMGCDDLRPEDMVAMDLEGNRVEGMMNPSPDTATRLKLYRASPKIGGVVYTYSPFATFWAQAERGIPCYETTHADYFYEEIPCAGDLTPEKVEEDYEKNTGEVIVKTFTGKNPIYVPGALCKNHGPFIWGKNTAQAVHNTVTLEEIVKMSLIVELLNPDGDNQISQCMQDKHLLRRHGLNAYYGQGREQL